MSLESSDGVDGVRARARAQAHRRLEAVHGLRSRRATVPSTLDARFVISTRQAGTFWLNQVSLFPPTYRGRPNGNRIDLMQMMAALRPTFLRLPGGNFLEGNTIADRFEWKNTIGPLAARPGHQGPWGYRSSDGLGLLEYLEWCEDLGMEPVLAVYAGYSLNGTHVNPGPDLEPYVQDALDEIEYVTGDLEHRLGRAARRRTATRGPSSSPTSRSATRTSSTARAATRAASPSSTTPSGRPIRSWP